MALTDKLTDIADAIREKSGKTEKMTPAEMPGEIAALRIQTKPKDVNFYDYDGTLLYSYTLAEAQNLTELPAGPTNHEDLRFHSWNWTLDAVQSLRQKMNIGALYTPADGATHLHIRLDTALMLALSLNLYVSAAGGVRIEWGDGESTIPAADGYQTITHTYAETGDYVIRIFRISGTYKLGMNSASHHVLGAVADFKTRGILQQAHMGPGSTMSQFACYFNTQMQYITLNPEETYLSVETQSLSYCFSLACLHIPNGSIPIASWCLRAAQGLRMLTFGSATMFITLASLREFKSLTEIRLPETAMLSEGYIFYDSQSLRYACGKTDTGNIQACYNCGCLEEFNLFDGSTGIASGMFQECLNLRRIDIPATVTSIQANAFSGCHSLGEIHLRAATPPMLADGSAFAYVPGIFYVPTGALEAYQTAPNWSAFADRMQEE